MKDAHMLTRAQQALTSFFLNNILYLLKDYISLCQHDYNKIKSHMEKTEKSLKASFTNFVLKGTKVILLF